MNAKNVLSCAPKHKRGIETPALGEGIETGTDESTDQGFLDSRTEAHPDSSLGSREDQIEDPERSGGSDSQLM